MSRNKLALLLAFIAIAAIGSLLVVRGQADKPADNQNGNSGTTRKESKTPPTPPGRGALDVRLETAKDSYAYGDSVVFTSHIRNRSDAAKTYTFNSTCTQGKLFIDGRQSQAGQICGAALTDVTLQPDEEKTYRYEFKLVRSFSQPVDGTPLDYDGELLLQPGKHRAHLEWQDARSAELTFDVR